MKGSTRSPWTSGRTTSRCSITAITSWWALGLSSSRSWSYRFVLLRRGSSIHSRPMALGADAGLPFPYIANTAGWMTAELGRQPWLIYGLMRTAEGIGPCSSGNTMFTLIGFLGVYHVLSILFLFLVYREIEHGPEPARRSDMETLWFWLVAIMIAGLRGAGRFRPGGGHRALCVARTARTPLMLRPLGPVWDGNEVWLLAAGGRPYFAFPSLYSSAFSGFYLPLMVVLWLLLLRGIAIESRHRCTMSCGPPSGTWCSRAFPALLANLLRSRWQRRPGGQLRRKLTNSSFRSGGSPGHFGLHTVIVALLAFAALLSTALSGSPNRTHKPIESRGSAPPGPSGPSPP